MTTDESEAARLIGAQFPEVSALPVRRLPSTGTVNALFRVGEDLVARFPFEPVPVEELREEARAMGEFRAASPFPSPEPIGVGAPTGECATAWTLQTWLEGTPATPDGLEESDALADDIAGLVAALRSIPVGDRRFDGRGRGGDLRDHDAWMTKCLTRSAGLLDIERARSLWSRLRGLGAPDAVAMSHRDLTPMNLLVRGGRLAGVLDSGSFGAADRALDLVAAWHLFDAPRRARLRRALQVEETEWLRGAGWALQQAMGLGWYYAETNPTMSRLGLSTVQRLLSDPELAQ